MDCSVSKSRFIVGEYEPLLLRCDLKKRLTLCKNGVDDGSICDTLLLNVCFIFHLRFKKSV